MAAPDHPGASAADTERVGPGTVTRTGIREAQRAWIDYRDAWIAFAAGHYWQLDDSLATWLTRQRADDLALQLPEQYPEPGQDVPPRFHTQMARFHDSLTTGAPLPVTSADSRRALEMVTAFYYSSRTREEVVFPIGKEHPNYQSWLPEGFA